jgi:hypothetical protein
MSPASAERWSQSNDAYLAAAMEWLRVRLIRLGAANRPALAEKPAAAAAEVKPHCHWFAEWFAHCDEPDRKPKFLPSPSPEGMRRAIAEAAERMQAAETMDPPPALALLARRFQLSRFERDVLLLCAAMEFDTGIGALCAQAQGDAGRRWPTFALALTLFDEPAWDVLSPERPLRSWRLIEVVPQGAQPLTASALRADERIVNYVKGLNYLDDRLTPLLTMVDPAAEALPPSQESLAAEIAAAVQAHAGSPPVVHLLGADAGGKQWLAARACQLLRLTLLKMPAELLPANAAEIDNLARHWRRESALLPLALYVEAQDSGKEAEIAGRFLSRTGGVLFLATREACPGVPPEVLTFDVRKPAPEEQREVWKQVLGEGREATAGRLAAQFDFGVPEIRRVARALQTGNGAPADGRLWNACLVAARPRLDSLAQRIDAKADWDALVIADAERRLLRQIAAQVRSRLRVHGEWGFARRMNRGLGITALFSGESGTGKTMAAEVIANELRLDLYRIDLSAVVSKYIGETEKNLRRVFDAAEDGGSLLFFDEADALFGKRSEVKDSHDRYANIEVNYLLQRMEAYSGLAILATNMRSALDPAFLRRVRFIVNFAFPGVAERKQIWRNAFPAETPLESLDYDRLARFNLTGANIQSIALNAAFLAADAGGKVGMPLVLEAARAEFRKLDKPVNDADFRWVEPKGAAA